MLPHHSIFAWLGFLIFIIAMLLLDLFIFNKKSHEVQLKEGLFWSAIWIAIAMAFNIGLWAIEGHDAAMSFFAGYILEKSLSIDNIFVFILIFSYFKVPKAYQHRVLFLGIVGAIISRGIFIALGMTLIHKFDWILYVFGAILLVSGIKLFFENKKEIEPEKNPIIKFTRAIIPFSTTYDKDHFWTKQSGKWVATPLFLVLIFIEASDIIFAIDSVPAVMSITQDPFIVFTSNIFAILGLRALYFVLNGIMPLFKYLHYGLGGVLTFIGIKMLISKFIHIPTSLSLFVILFLIGGSILFSIARAKYELKHLKK